MSEERIDVIVSAQTGDLSAGMTRAGQSVKNATRDMEQSFRLAGGAADDLKGELAGLFTLGALGAFVKSTKDAVTQAESSFRGLEAVANHTGVGIGRAFQEAEKLASDGLVSVADASKSLQNLLSRGYSLEQAVQVLERLKDAAAFNRASHLSMSEAVLSATDGLKNENSVLVDNAGVTKNVAKMWEEYAAQLGKSANDLTQAEKIQAEYNGIMRETEAQVGNAQKAMEGLQGAEARLQQESNKLKTAIGTGLVPALTALSQAGASVIDGWVKPFLGGVEIMALKLAALGNMVATVSNHQYKATTVWGKMKEQAEAWRDAYHDSFELADEMAMEVVAKYTGGLSPSALAMTTGNAPAAGTGGGGRAGGSASAAAPGKSKKSSEPASRVSDWKLDLERQQDASGSLGQDLAAERAFWQQKLGIARAGSAEQRQVESELLRVNREIRQQDFQREIAELQEKKNAATTSAEERIRIAGEVAQRIGEKYGLESKEYRAALQEMSRAAQARQQEINRLTDMETERSRQHNLALLAMEQERLDLAANLGDISAEERLRKLQEVKQREFEIERQALEQRLALLGPQEVIARQQILDQLAALEDRHAQQSQQLQDQTTLAVRDRWQNVLGAVNSAVDTSIQGLILGTTTWRKAFANIGQAILAEFVGMTVKMATRWVATEAAKTTATSTGASVRTGIEGAAAVKSVAIWAWAAIKNIAASAWEAAAKVYSAIAAIPYVGPFLAPAMAVGAAATIIGFGAKIASGAGGWEVPNDQIMQVHKEEVILPAAWSRRLKTLADGMEGPGGGSGGNTSITIQAVDARSVERLFNENGGALVKALKTQVRNFNR